MSVIRKVYDGIGWFSDKVGEVSKWIIIAVILTTTFEVFMRYVLNAPTMWAWATTQMLGAAFIALGLANNHRINKNVRVDIISMRFSPKVRAALEVFFTIIFFFPLTYILTRLFIQDAFFALSINQVDNTSAWSPITWPYKMVVAAGILFLLIQGVATFLKDVLVLKKGGNEPW
ncbi:MAG: TRAP transporter small permease subunit [Dehalococcoidia bacterium]|nr:TRAP transporter small permease subunit [Dehalococcoidia bacterium]